MFKKTLVALALTGLSTAALAADVTGADQKVSLEGVAVSGELTQADLTNPEFIQGAEYIVNDVVAITVTGAKFDTSVDPVLSTNRTTGAPTFAFVDFQGDNVARFRVSTNNSPKGDTLSLSTFTLDTSDAVAKGKVSFSSKAISVNPSIGDYDASKATSTAPAFTYVSQLTSDLTKFDGVITTSKGRQEFTTGLSDVLTVDLANATSSIKPLTFTKLTHVLKGSDFSFAMDYDANKDGKLSAAELGNALTIATKEGTAANQDTFAAKLNDNMTELTITQTIDTAGTKNVDSFTVTANVKGQTAKGSVLTKQSFTFESTAVTASTGSASIAAASAGAWTLDGSSDDIELMPFGTEYAQSITVANRGTVEGAITVTLKAEGKTYTKELTQVAAANSVTNISLEVAAFAKESGITGNAHVNVVVNAPSGNIGVKGVYYHKASADRVLTY